MTNHVRLDNVEHKDLTVEHAYSAQYGHEIGAVTAFITELSDIQREYPILLQKDETTNKYQAIAMLGLAPDENLFIEPQGTGWNANYIPATFAKGPFLIGYENQISPGENTQTPVLHIDLDDQRVNSDSGKAIFKPHGGNTDYLDSIAQILDGISQGAALADDMFEMFDSLDLIEPLSIDVKLVNGDKLRIIGNHTINAQRLASLSGEELKQLNDAGYLQGAFLMASSLDNMKRLIELKNARIVAAS